MRSVAIITGPETHLDHLGVLSTLLQIPLLVTEEKLYRAAKEFYPDLDAVWMDFSELSLEYLATHYDAIFETGKFWAADLRPSFELLFQKKMRFVFCPHGNSDKGHTLQKHAEQDISLVYGDHLQDLLTKTGAMKSIHSIVRTGNYRYSYYLRHHSFFDHLANTKVFSRFKIHQPVILYAPTWNDKENPTSFFTATDALISQLSCSYNLLIKLHPFLFEDHPAHVYRIMAHYEKHPSVLFLEEFPPIYPLLARCALYLGDFSSIGYDFLAFNKPLYFLNSIKSSTSPLHRCGTDVSERLDGQLNKFLSETLEANTAKYAAERKKVYLYAFGNEQIGPFQLKREIFNKLA
jgi:hypothetical protein